MSMPMNINEMNHTIIKKGLDIGSFMGAVMALNKGYREDNLHTKLVWGYPIHSLQWEEQEVAKVIDGLDEEEGDITLLYEKGTLRGGFLKRKEAYSYLSSLGEEENLSWDVVSLKLA